MSKLRFHVVDFTSEMDGYPAEELNVHGPNTKGWQSDKFTTYPQEIVIELDDGEARLSQIQILSHQSKISSKIEIFIGQGSTYQTAKYKRLGYLTLDPNEKTDFKARELKTVYIDHIGSFIRFVIHKSYVNQYNYFNQVGIIAINLMGSEMVKSSNGLKSFPPVVNNPLNDLSIDMNLDPQTTLKLRQLSEAKAKAVATEDYITAKKIKSIENDLKELGSRLSQLEIEKRSAVESEDYDQAKSIKDEMDALRSEIDHKISTINVPGITDYRPLPIKSNHEDYKPNSARQTLSKPTRVIKDVDDIPVGGNYSSENKDYSSPLSNRKQYDESEDIAIHNNVDNNLDSTRPIKPKANLQYDDTDTNIDNNAYSNNNEERFPPGQHPLEGIDNYADLPAPEQLIGKSKEIAETTGIVGLIGEYRARCLFSKTWSLRDAVLTYVYKQLRSSKYDKTPGIYEAFPALASISKVSVDDKMQAVFLNGITVLEEILSAAKRAKLSKSVAGPLMEPVLSVLIEKLADTNIRIQNGAKKGIDLFVNSPIISTNIIANHTLKPLLSKYQSNWKFVLSRIKLLIDVVSVIGIGNNTGYTAENILNFVKNLNGFAHGTGEVRDASKDLTVLIHKYIDIDVILPYLSSLRKLQLDEYYAAFGSENTSNNNNNKPKENANTVTTPKANNKSPNTNKQPNNKQNKDNNKTNNNITNNQSTNNPTNPSNDKQDEISDFTICMFCGESDKSWNEDALDLHYWKSCPLLTPCPACAQVVEIAGLPEHLLDECEHKSDYVPCEVTGLAIRKNEMNDWQNSNNCKPPPENCIYCPLCLSSVEDSDEAWKQHLVRGCPLNTRIQQ
mmetsp:Transcript_9912/g.8858  ORF Transcript_9912/g.8858 Transcript_9912/m.8858 type:complete len:843 (-) Transcript_9912:96-2624(-)